MSDKPSFFAELKRRHVFRVAVAYVVVSWLLLQLGAIIFPALHAPSWCEAVLLAFLVLGFPVAVLLAWAFEVTPEGVRRTESAESETARPVATGRRVGRTLDFVIIVILAAAVGVLLWRQFSISPNPQTTHVALATTAVSAPANKGAVIPAKSIAVLPFANDSGNPDQRYFSDGLSDDLIIALSQYPALTVIGRESSFQLRGTTLDSEQIGVKLGVANLLEGSVSRAGEEVRVRAELVSTATGRTLWSDRYDRPYRNLFALQDEITKAVAAALKAKLLGSGNSGAVVQTERPPSGSLAAYNAYLEGNFYVNQFTEVSIRKAVAAYQQAIDTDPNYAAAYARLGYVWSTLGGYFLSGSAKEQAVAKGRSAIDTAIRLNPNLAAAYVARGRLLQITLDWRGAEAAFRHALMLDPTSADARKWLAISLARFGRLDEAIHLGHEAVAANPLDAQAYHALALYLTGAGQLKAATQAIDRAISLQPTADNFHTWLAAIEVLRGDPKAALQAARVEPLLNGRTWALTLAYQAAGDKARADQALQQYIAMNADLGAYQVAEIYAYRGELDQAFIWLDRAWRQRDPGVGSVLFDPFLRRYKNDPRFIAFLRKIGLAVPGSAPTAATAVGTHH